MKSKTAAPARRVDSTPLHRVRVAAFGITLGLGLLVSFILPLRPTVSETEKRTLSEFPAFSTKALFDGSYFKGIDLWFSDTFPLRETLITANARIKNLYGIFPVQVHGDVEQGDDIPDAPPPTTAPEETSAPTETTTVKPTTTAPVIDAPDMADTQSFGAVLMVGDAAFEYYTFKTDIANRYSAMVNATAAKLGDNAAVYAMVVPSSMGIMLPDSMRATVNSSDQNRAIGYMYASMSNKVRTVDVWDALMARRKDYIYFRSDHHWTATGAYYGYAQFVAAKGVIPVPLAEYESVSYEGFLGSFYASTNKNTQLSKNPDTVVAYKPVNNTSMTFTDTKGNTIPWKVISDVTNWSASAKYSTFIGGDNPYSVITNKDLDDGSSCIVVKESYGNALVPFLIPHYQTVHVVDYRYWNGSLPSFVEKNGIQDVLFITNISATRSDKLVSRMENISK